MSKESSGIVRKASSANRKASVGMAAGGPVATSDTKSEQSQSLSENFNTAVSMITARATLRDKMVQAINPKIKAIKSQLDRKSLVIIELVKILERECNLKRFLMNIPEYHDLTMTLLTRVIKILPEIYSVELLDILQNELEVLRQYIGLEPEFENRALNLLGFALHEAIFRPNIPKTHLNKTLRECLVQIDGNLVENSIRSKGYFFLLEKDMRMRMPNLTLNEIQTAYRLYRSYYILCGYYKCNFYYAELELNEPYKKRIEILSDNATFLLSEAMKKNLSEVEYNLLDKEVKRAVRLAQYIVSNQPINYFLEITKNASPAIKDSFNELHNKYIIAANQFAFSECIAREKYVIVKRILDEMCNLIFMSTQDMSSIDKLFESMSAQEDLVMVENDPVDRASVALRIITVIEGIAAQKAHSLWFINLRALLQPMAISIKVMTLETYRGELEHMLTGLLFPHCDLYAMSSRVTDIVNDLRLSMFEFFESSKVLRYLSDINKSLNTILEKDFLNSSEEIESKSFIACYAMIKIWNRYDFTNGFSERDKDNLRDITVALFRMRNKLNYFEDIIERYESYLERKQVNESALSAPISPSTIENVSLGSGIAAKRRARRKAKRNSGESSSHHSDSETCELAKVIQNNVDQEALIKASDADSIAESRAEAIEIALSNQTGGTVGIAAYGGVVTDTSNPRPLSSTNTVRRLFARAEQGDSKAPEQEVNITKVTTRNSIEYYFNKCDLGYICIDYAKLSLHENTLFRNALANGNVKRLEIGIKNCPIYELCNGAIDSRLIGKRYNLTYTQMKKYFELKITNEVKGAAHMLEQIEREKGIGVIIFDEYATNHTAINRCAKRLAHNSYDYAVFLDAKEQLTAALKDVAQGDGARSGADAIIDRSRKFSNSRQKFR